MRKVLLEGMFIRSHLLHDGMSYRWTCLAGIHIVCVDMYY